jgi:hypothetical protein
MPTLPPAVGCAKIYFKGQLGGQGPNTGTIFHVKRNDTNPMVAGDIDNLANALKVTGTSNPLNKFAASLSSSWVWASVTVTDLGGTGYINQEACAQTGAATGAFQPIQCAVAVSWHALGITWRGGRPRNYFSGVPTSASFPGNGAQLTTTYCSALVTAAVAFQNAIELISLTGSATPQLGMVSYHSHGAIRATPLFLHYAGVNVHQRLDSQRRRSGKESSFGVS